MIIVFRSYILIKIAPDICHLPTEIFSLLYFYSELTVGVPVTVYCKMKFGYVQLGGITINSVALTKSQQDEAEQECDHQMALMEVQRKNLTAAKRLKGTQCHLSFPSMNVSGSDMIGLVYECLNTKPHKDSPHKWSKGKKKYEEKEGELTRFFNLFVGEHIEKTLIVMEYPMVLTKALIIS